jgi:IS5 family transposase
MLRIHLVQQWYDLTDPAMEDALIEMPIMRRFAGIDMISDQIPDETTILTFRHLLEKYNLGQQIVEVVKAVLPAHGEMARALPRPWPSGHLQLQLTHHFTLSLQLAALQQLLLREILRSTAGSPRFRLALQRCSMA